VWIEAGLVGYGPPPGPGYDARSLWWRHERLHRRALADLDGFLASFAPERDALERELVQRAASATTRQERCDVTARAFADAAELESRWLARLEAKAPSLWWRLLNAQSGMPA
jgi:dipeptidase